MDTTNIEMKWRLFNPSCITRF